MAEKQRHCIHERGARFKMGELVLIANEVGAALQPVALLRMKRECTGMDLLRAWKKKSDTLPMNGEYLVDFLVYGEFAKDLPWQAIVIPAKKGDK